MKHFTINIHPKLPNVTFTVKNGRQFVDKLTRGEYCRFVIDVCESDLKRVKQFAVHQGNDKSSCCGNWYAHCIGFAMDLCVTNRGKVISINTYRPYGKE